MPRLTNNPFLTMNGFLALGFLSISGTSTCHPVKSFPLNRLLDCAKEKAEFMNKMMAIVEVLNSFIV